MATAAAQQLVNNRSFGKRRQAWGIGNDDEGGKDETPRPGEGRKKVSIYYLTSILTICWKSSLKPRACAKTETRISVLPLLIFLLYANFISGLCRPIFGSDVAPRWGKFERVYPLIYASLRSTARYLSVLQSVVKPKLKPDGKYMWKFHPRRFASWSTYIHVSNFTWLLFPVIGECPVCFSVDIIPLLNIGGGVLGITNTLQNTILAPSNRCYVTMPPYYLQ